MTYETARVRDYVGATSLNGSVKPLRENTAASADISKRADLKTRTSLTYGSSVRNSVLSSSGLCRVNAIAAGNPPEDDVREGLECRGKLAGNPVESIRRKRSRSSSSTEQTREH